MIRLKNTEPERPHEGRKTLSKRDRVKVFDKEGGLCYLCGQTVQAGQAWEVEHENPVGLSNDNSLDNLRIAHNACHKTKTAKDVKVIAKVKRVRALHIGAKKPTGRPLPGTKASGWKHSMTKGWVRR